MIRRNQRTINLLNVLSDMAINIGAFLLAYGLRFIIFEESSSYQPVSDYVNISLLNAVLSAALYLLFHLYEPKRRTNYLKDISIIIRANIVDVLLVGIVLYLIKYIHFSRLLLVLYFIIGTVLVLTKHIILRYVLQKYRSKGHNIKNILLVGNGELAQKYINEIHAHSQLGYNIVGIVADNRYEPMPDKSVKVLGKIDKLDDILNDSHCDEIVIAFDEDSESRMESTLNACNRHGIRFSIIPSFTKYIYSAAAPSVETIGTTQLFDFCASPLDITVNKVVKRILDIIASVLLLVLVSPVLLIAAIGVKLSSPGPVIFIQKRIGRNKQPFDMYKFRSMRINVDQETAWSAKGDARKTKFGQFIRKTSIDELPQLVNVLKGNMSLIGPRPEIPFHVNHFRDEIPYYMARHQIRPGLTGWAQVNGLRGDTSIEERVNYDLYYIYNWSLLLDFEIFFKTIWGGIINKAE